MPAPRRSGSTCWSTTWIGNASAADPAIARHSTIRGLGQSGGSIEMKQSVKRAFRAMAAAMAVMAVLASSVPAAAALPFGKVVIRHADFTVGFNAFTTATAHCPRGYRIVSGGVQMLGDNTARSSSSTWLGSSYPTADLKGWTGSAASDFTGPYTFRVIV